MRTEGVPGVAGGLWPASSSSCDVTQHLLAFGSVSPPTLQPLRSMEACTAGLLYVVTMLRQCLSTALQLLDVLAEGSDAAVEPDEVLSECPKATRGTRQGLLQHYSRHQHAEKRGAATNAQPKCLGMLFRPLEENGPIDLLQLRREGGALSCAPSADAVAGNGGALSCAPSADAVAGNGGASPPPDAGGKLRPLRRRSRGERGRVKLGALCPRSGRERSDGRGPTPSTAGRRRNRPERTWSLAVGRETMVVRAA